MKQYKCYRCDQASPRAGFCDKCLKDLKLEDTNEVKE